MTNRERNNWAPERLPTENFPAFKEAEATTSVNKGAKNQDTRMKTWSVLLLQSWL